MQPLSRLEFREKYGGIPQDRSVLIIDPEDVPVALRPLIPLAEKWGIVEDDWRPLDIVDEVAKDELDDLVRNVAPFCTDRVDDPFNLWLAGPESMDEELTTAYLAFSELRLVYDNAKWELEH